MSRATELLQQENNQSKIKSKSSKASIDRNQQEEQSLNDQKNKTILSSEVLENSHDQEMKEKILKGTVPEKLHLTEISEDSGTADICNLAGLPAYCKIVKAALKMENQDAQLKKSRVDLASLPTRQYLDQTVVPILMNALSHLAKERPPEPIAALAAYLLKNRGNFEQVSTETSLTTESEKA